MDSIAVREIDAADRDRVVAVQVMAFGSDPMMRWMYPDPKAYLEHYPKFVRAFGGAAFEHGTAWEADDFGGASLWLPPGVEVDPEPLVELMQTTLSPRVMEDAGAMLEQMGAYHIDEPHWYLPMIGVDPAKQGKGLGSALLRYALARCDEAGLPAYLESSNTANVPLYERHGFEVVGKIQAGSSPTAYPMLRTAR